MPDRRRATGRVPSGADREPASRRTPAPAPPPHAAALTLQAAAGNRAVQRLIALDSARLYYDRTRLGLGNDADRAKENAWKRGITSNTGMAPNEITAQNFIGLRGIGGWDGVVLGAIRQKLEAPNRVFDIPGYRLAAGTQHAYVSSLATETITKVLRPVDMVDEASLIKDPYAEDLACVLQGLVNAGAALPDLSQYQGANDYEKLHKYVRATGNKDYDLDQVVYDLYRSLGLTLVVNDPTKWERLALAPGDYIFTMPGHNFAVTVVDAPVPAQRYQPKDEPQRRVLRYTPDLVIKYVWKV